MENDKKYTDTLKHNPNCAHAFKPITNQYTEYMYHFPVIYSVA